MGSVIFNSTKGRRRVAGVPRRDLYPPCLRLFWSKRELLNSHVGAFLLYIKELKMHFIGQKERKSMAL